MMLKFLARHRYAVQRLGYVAITMMAVFTLSLIHI
jgi:hypothetical protein